MKLGIIINLVILLLGVALSEPVSAAVTAPDKVVSQALPKQGKKVTLGTDHYFTFEFEKSPKVGQAIMKVEIFTLKGKRDTSFIVKGDMDMPSMRGAHGMGDKNFVLSAKGIYLLPAHIAMPGDWEFKFTFEKNGKTVFHGAYLFDI